jgi:5-methylcytosine-specific restriction endonuclease McrBC regulatory subunit McrC
LIDVPLQPLTPELIDQVHLTNLESEWQDALDLAAALVRGQAPSPVVAGKSRMFTLLLSMSDLFERLLRRRLNESLARTGLELATRSGGVFLLRSVTTATQALPMRPDFLFHRRGETTQRLLVGDAKWKRLKQRSRSFGMSSSDVYQLATYMASHGLSNGILFFPLAEWMTGPEWEHSFYLAGREAIVHVLAVDVPALVSRDRGTREAASARLAGLIERIAARNPQPVATAS